MDGRRISNLPAQTTPLMTDIFPEVQGSTTYKTALQNVADLFFQQPTIYQPNIVGVTNNSSSPAGSVGEYISASLLAANSVSLTTTTAANVISIVLTPGDWSIAGTVSFQVSAPTVTTSLYGAINTTSATLPTVGSENNVAGLAFGQSPATQGSAIATPGPMRLSINSTTTVYLIAFAVFTTSFINAYGFIGARRVR